MAIGTVTDMRATVAGSTPGVASDLRIMVTSVGMVAAEAGMAAGVTAGIAEPSNLA
jgi:hypothetical protein